MNSNLNILLSVHAIHSSFHFSTNHSVIAYLVLRNPYAD